MNRPAVVLLLTALILGNCTLAPASPTPPSPVTAPQNVTPSETPLPTQTVTPIVTPYPSLQTDGPYLLYADGNNSLTVMDADGIGRKQFEIPIDGRLGWYLENTVSPNGKWIAYYTGSSDEEPYDLALHLFDVSNNTSYLISKLIAPGFPENLEPVTKTLYFPEYDAQCESDLKCQISRVQSAFKEGMWHSIDWSPNSKFLAFAAQIDGPSSDIYIFDVELSSIRRLTDELETIWSIDWSPNSEKILYEYSIMGDTYLSRYICIADLNIKSLQHPKAIDGGAFWFEYGWIDQNSYLIYSGGEGAPPHRLRIISIETKEVKEIWNYSAESFFVDLNRQTIILSPYGRIYLQPEPEKGIYTISFDGQYQKVSDEIVYFIEGQDAVDEYIAITQQNQLVGVKFDGSITPLSRKPDYYVPPRSSPDGKWIVITSETETEIYSKDLKFMESLGIHATDIIWRPDSAGVFLYSDPTLYYLSMDDKNLSEICVQGNCRPFDHVWLP